MRKGLFHMENNRLFKTKINTTGRNISIYNHSGEFSHTYYQMKRAGEKSVRNRTFGQHDKWPNARICNIPFDVKEYILVSEDK